MPYIITKKNGKPYKWDRARPLLSQHDVADFARDGARVGDCWTFASPVTRRSITVGACKNPTPSHLWGAKKARARKKRSPRGLGFPLWFLHMLPPQRAGRRRRRR